MTISPGFRDAMVIVSLFAISAVAFAPIARAAPLPDGMTASGGVVPQPAECSDARKEDERCVPRGPGFPTRPGRPVLPPVTPPAPPGESPEILTEELPRFIGGKAQARLHITDDHQDVTYKSNEVRLLFMKRPVQDMLGNTQYVLYGPPEGGLTSPGSEPTPISMTWTVNGRVFDCTVEGQAIITFPLAEPDPNIPGGGNLFDPTRHTGRPAYGYLNVVGLDGGDFHSVIVSAFDADARYTKTCPGDPPIVTKEPFEAGYLLHILWQKNTHEEGRIIFKGMLSYDYGKVIDRFNASRSGIDRLYTWEWELWPAGPRD